MILNLLYYILCYKSITLNLKLNYMALFDKYMKNYSNIYKQFDASHGIFKLITTTVPAPSSLEIDIVPP